MTTVTPEFEAGYAAGLSGQEYDPKQCSEWKNGHCAGQRTMRIVGGPTTPGRLQVMAQAAMQTKGE